MNKASSANEWVGWDTAVRIVRTAGVGLHPYETLAELCAQGQVDTKAALIIGGGETLRDNELEPSIWRLTKQRGVYLDPFDGSIKCNLGPTETESARTMTITGPLFRKDQLLEVFAHLDPAEVQEALSAKGLWLEPKRRTIDVTPAAPPPGEKPTGAKRGRKTDKAKWTAFWHAAIELAKAERLQRGCFNSAQELGDELLLMMGDDSFSYDHVKAEVGQIYKRFVGD